MRHAPWLMSQDVPLLLFADNLVLLRTSQEGLHRLLNALQMVCEKRQLRVSLIKTEVVVFKPERKECGALTYI